LLIINCKLYFQKKKNGLLCYGQNTIPITLIYLKYSASLKNTFKNTLLSMDNSMPRSLDTTKLPITKLSFNQLIIQNPVSLKKSLFLKNCNMSLELLNI